jgi:hypothetical protein
MPSPDIAGALAAIEAAAEGQFPALPIALPNTDPEDPTQPWPPVDSQGKPRLWIFCEVVDTDAKIIAFGKPGSQTILEIGFAKFFVMVAKGSGEAEARAQATAIGEIFRQAKFFDTTPPAYVRTTTPRVGSDPMESEDGATVAGACCTVPYEFLHQA